jgi:DNA-binding NtrC family response regulator
MMETCRTYRENTQTILIVDDNEIILESLVKSFKALGFNVFKAENGFDAWRLFKEWPIDIVLTDIRMPYIDGAELSRRIRNRSPKTTIAVMTGGYPDAATSLLADSVVDYFFEKPFAINHIRKTLSIEVQSV